MNRHSQKLRSFLIWVTVSGLTVTQAIADGIAYGAPANEIGWRDYLRWWTEGRLEAIFGWAYNGSDEEIEAVFNDEVPFEYMSKRQRVMHFFTASGAIQN